MEAKKSKILLADDETYLLDIWSADLAREGYNLSCAEDGVEALKKLEKEQYDIAIVDLVMPKMDGMELLDRIKEEYPETEVIILTGHGTIQSAVDAMKMGAYSYLVKPYEPDEVLAEIRKIEELQSLRLENKYLREEFLARYQFGKIIGRDEKMLQIYDLIENIAKTNSSVLIQGESGTGKELIAHAIHYNSLRNTRPFVIVNCAALPENLLENELFGHEKGAFTNAVSQKKGRFELADGGTIFLDEIGDMSKNLQAKLLRVLQEGEFERVGGTGTIKVDVRLITATNRDIEKEVKEGNFREDLFYRVNVITMKVPPLRERKGDIPLLVAYFLQKYRSEIGKNTSSVSKRALDLMKSYPWPGNIRELENVIERAVVLAKTDEIDVQDLPDALRGRERRLPETLISEDITFKEAKRQFEKDFLEEMLRKNNGNVTRTAEAIQMPRRNLHEKIRTYNIDIDKLRNQE